MSYTWIEIIFWALLFGVFYTYIGYGLLLYILVKIQKTLGIGQEKNFSLPGKEEDWPAVTFMVAAWNEAPWMKTKIENCLAFDYPSDKLFLYFVTDGSDDGTPEIVKNYPYPDGVNVTLFHEDKRAGKIAAVERVMPEVHTDYIIYTDANTDVNPLAIKNIVRHYANPLVGAVSGEKRVLMGEKDSAAASEGFYWKYESFLKRLDSAYHSVVGAAGELFSIRTELFSPVSKDTLVEDFVMTMTIAMNGYKVVYEPDAFACEQKSASVGEELKRKIRIAAGGLQAAVRLKDLFNIFKYGKLSFQYISHRVLRWVFAPLALPVLFFLNLYLFTVGSPVLYSYLFYLQCGFYGLAILGMLFQKMNLRIKIFFIPYYFVMMNVAMYRGFFRLIKGRQSVLWERAKRSDEK